MSAVPLPTIEQWLTTLIPRVRALRVAHGVSCLVAAALGSVSVVLFLDAGFGLPAWARGLFLSVWLTALGVLAWRWVLVPWRGEMPLAEVAREVEKHHPELGERLRVAVTDDTASPTGAVRAAMLEDTARRLKTIDPVTAVPLRGGMWLATIAGGALLGAAGAIVFIPGSSDRLRRVAAPWYRPGASSVRVIVTSGEPVVKRGAPVTLTAYAERAGGTFSTEATLVVRDGPNSPEARTSMAGDGGAFHATRPNVTSDFEYCVEVRGARSDWFRVTVLDAVELADGTRLEIAAPDYAKRPKRVLTALTDFDGLQFGMVNFQLKFTRPASAASFDWRSEGAARSDMLPIELAPDRLSAIATVPLRGSGVLRLLLTREENGKKLRTETAMAVRVARDEAPWFEEVSGVLARPRTVRPDARVPITFVARDDANVTGAVLEYHLDTFDSATQLVPIPLVGTGTPRVAGRLELEMADKSRVSRTIRFRIRVTDNRVVDDLKLGPQEVFYPPSGWCELKFDPNAPPLDQQEIAGQRDGLRDALALASKELKELASEVAALRTETAGMMELAVDKAVRLNNARERLATLGTRLNEAARDAALAPELRPLAAVLREVVERPLKAAGDSLRAAETDDPTVRKDALNTAGLHLTAADARLAEVLVTNARLGQERLDRALLASLAGDQTTLADSSAPPATRLARQRELLARLAEITEASPSLKFAAEGAKGEEVRRLVAELAALATRLRDLDAAARQTVMEARATLVAAIARDQETVSKRAAGLFPKLETAARLAGVVLPAPEDFRRVVELAATGKTVDALAELEKHAQTLERVAGAFEKWHAGRTDTKLGAKQLALWQDDLRTRFLAAVKVAEPGKLPDEVRVALASEQKVLQTALAALSLPPDDGVKTIHSSTLQHARRAGECLALDGAGADEAMKLAADSLTRLSERTPNVAERLARSLREFEKLRQELDSSGNAIDQVLKTFEQKPPDAATSAAIVKRAAPFAERQRKLIAATAALDLPGLSERQARVVLALKAAAIDLQDGSPLDVQASQAWARREFERLKLVLEGHPSPDLKSDDLSRKLRTLVESLDALGPNPTKVEIEPALPVVLDVQRLLSQLVAVEAPALLNDARVATQAAENAFRDGKLTPADVRERIRLAAGTLEKLADRLNGHESDLDRVKRLASNRRVIPDKLKEWLASDEAGRLFAREADELTATRVGAAGQLHKKRALDLYVKLRSKVDATGSDLKSLVTTLDELAGKMTDVAELTAGVARPAPASASEADSFLPARPAAELLRELAKQQRALHGQVNNLTAELSGHLRPAKTNPFPALEAKQRAVSVEAMALAKQLATVPGNKAAEAATLAAERLVLAQVRPAKEEAETAANFFRQLATAGTGKPWGKTAESLVTQQDAVLRELTELLGAPNAAAAHQVMRLNELAGEVAEFAGRLEGVAKSFGPDDMTGALLAECAQAMSTGAKHLAEATRKAHGGTTGEAEKYRAAAGALIRDSGEKLTGIATPTPPGANVAVGLALRAAERHMRAAMDSLAAEDSASAEKAMRAATTALQEAARNVGK